MPSATLSAATLNSRELPSLGLVENDKVFRDLNIREVIRDAEDSRLEFVCYFVGGEKRALLDVSKESVTVSTLPPITVVDIQLAANDWGRRIVGRFSPWIDVDRFA